MRWQGRNSRQTQMNQLHAFQWGGHSSCCNVLCTDASRSKLKFVMRVFQVSSACLCMLSLCSSYSRLKVRRFAAECLSMTLRKSFVSDLKTGPCSSNKALYDLMMSNILSSKTSITSAIEGPRTNHSPNRALFSSLLSSGKMQLMSCTTVIRFAILNATVGFSAQSNLFINTL